MSAHPFSKRMDFRSSPDRSPHSSEVWTPESQEEKELHELVDPRTLDIEDRILHQIDLERMANRMADSAAALKAKGWPEKEPLRENRKARIFYHE